MVTNTIILIILVGLTFGAVRLMLRAWRAGVLWKRIVGVFFSGLLTLLLAAISFFGGKGMLSIYFPAADPAPDISVEGTPEQIARGQYLADVGCILCHGTYEDGVMDFNPEFPLAGGLNIRDVEEGFPPIGQLVTQNLTPGGKLAGYSDGEIFRAIRHGIDQNGRRLGFMPFLPFGQMSDEDLVAVIAFLRSQPAVEPEGPTGTEFNFLGMIMIGANLFPPPNDNPAAIEALTPGPTAEYGKYVATFGECRGCHGPDMTGAPAEPPFSDAVPNPRPLVGSIDLAQFIEMFRSGVRPNGDPFPDGMPWRNASRMSDADLEALYVFLTTDP